RGHRVEPNGSRQARAAGVLRWLHESCPSAEYVYLDPLLGGRPWRSDRVDVDREAQCTVLQLAGGRERDPYQGRFRSAVQGRDDSRATGLLGCENADATTGWGV